MHHLCSNHAELRAYGLFSDVEEVINDHGPEFA